MKAICALLAFLFALCVMLPHHATYQVVDPAPVAVSQPR